MNEKNAGKIYGKIKYLLIMNTNHSLSSLDHNYIMSIKIVNSRVKTL